MMLTSDKVRVFYCGHCLVFGRGKMNTDEFGTYSTCTLAACTHWPAGHGDPAHSASRRELAGGVSSLAICCKEGLSMHYPTVCRQISMRFLQNLM